MSGAVDVWDVSDPANGQRTESASEGEVGTALTEESVPEGPVSLDDGTELTALAVSPDGSEVAVGHDDGTVAVATFGSDGSSPQSWRPLVGDLGVVNALAYRPDGQALAVATSDGVATVDRRPGAPAAATQLATGSWVSTIAYAPDGSLAWADLGSISVQPPNGEGVGWDTAGSTQSLVFSGTGDRLVAGGDDSSVTVWDVATGEVVGPPRTIRTGYAVRAVAVSPSGDRIAATADDGIVRQWPSDQTYGDTSAAITLPTTDAPTAATGFSHVSRLVVGSNHVAAARGDGGALIWQVEPGAAPQFAARIEPQPDSSTDSVALHEDRLGVADNDFSNGGSFLSLYDLSETCESGESCPNRSGEARMTTYATSIDFDRTGEYLVVGDEEGTVHLFGINADGTALTPLDSSCQVDSVINVLDVNPATDVVAVASDGAVQLCELRRRGGPRESFPWASLSILLVLSTHSRSPIRATNSPRVEPTSRSPSGRFVRRMTYP